MAEHSTLTGASLHEPKGVATATINKHYCSNGSGSGTWQKLTSSEVDTSSIFNVNKGKLVVQMDDISTASFVLVPFPEAVTFTLATIILSAGITSTDSILTFTNSTGPSTVGTKTITQSGSVEGSRFTFTPSVNNSFTTGSYMKIATDGASSTVSVAQILIDYTLTA